MRKVALVAGAMAKFGVREATFRDMIAEAGKAAFDKVPGLLPRDIDGFVLSSVNPERTAFQGHVASIGAELVGIRPTSLIQRVENLCASGSVGIRTAYGAIASGLSDLVMVIGVEKMYTPVPEENFVHMTAGTDRDWEGLHGITAPTFFAMVAQLHMREYGTTAEQMAMVSVKNHRFSIHNPCAQFQKPVTMEQALNSRPIATPLRLFDCSAMTDGAAAIILASEERAKELTNKPVYLLGTAQAGGGKNAANIPGWTSWPTLRLAAENAYRMAGVTAADIDVAETHDCFSISEIIEYEDLGFAEKGRGGEFIEAGLSDIGGKVAVNTGGGLLGRGHPLGATGVAQAIQIMAQLRGEAGPVQVKGASIGLTHNLSGLAAEHTIVIYGMEAA